MKKQFYTKIISTEKDHVKGIHIQINPINLPLVVQQSEQFICPDCKKPEKEYRDGLCEMCHKWHTS